MATRTSTTGIGTILNAERLNGHITLTVSCPNPDPYPHTVLLNIPADEVVAGQTEFGEVHCEFPDMSTGEICDTTSEATDLFGMVHNAVVGAPELEELLAFLGVDGDEIIALASLGTGDDARFTTEWVGPRSRVGGAARRAIAKEVNLWHGVYTLREKTKTRGSEKDVARVPGLRIDADVKKEGCASIDEAWGIVRGVEAVLGAPALVVFSGHGLQAYWPLDHQGHDLSEVKRLLARCNKLAELFGPVDDLKDLNRVMRTPESINLKYVDAPVGVQVVQRVAEADRRVLTLAEVVTAMDEAGVPEVADAVVLSGTVSSSAGWTGGAETCGYVQRMIDGWRSDPRPRERHTWALSQAVRVWSALRLGCLRMEDLEAAQREVERTFWTWFTLDEADQRRRSDPGEFERVWTWAAELVEKKDDAGCWADLGGEEHPHARVAMAAVGEGNGTVDDGLTEGALKTIPMGRRFARERLLGEYIFVPGFGWHQWTGTHWRMLGPMAPDHMARIAADWAVEFIKDLVAEKVSTDLIRAALRYRDIGSVVSLVQAARTHPKILVEHTLLNTHPELLTCANGVVDLRTGELLAHDPALLMTKSTGVDYRPDARHPDVDAALTAFAGVGERDWFIRFTGSAATGHPASDDLMPTLWGVGNNGKSSVLNGVVAALGDYAGPIPKTLLMSTRSNEHPAQVMTLFGLRLGYMEETADDHKLDVTKLKDALGTKKMMGRYMKENWVTFDATHSLVMSSNYRPMVVETDDGSWRRLEILAFPKRFGEDGLPDDPGIRRRITDKEQREAFLALIVAGAMEWFANGMTLKPVTDAMVGWKREWEELSDTIAAFAGERLVFDITASVEVEQVRAAFNLWAPQPHVPWGQRKFMERFSSHRLMRKYVVVDKAVGTRRSIFRGVRLRDAGRFGLGNE